MADFFDQLNARTQELANQGYTHSWASYAKQKAAQDRLRQLAEQRKAQTTQAPHKNFLQDQISTGGGIGGALAGGAAGAALGSVVPIVGTAAGGLIGAILGGGLGSAGGQVLENKVTGEQDLSKGVLNEGLIGAATSLPLGAGLKLARAGVQGLTGIGRASASQLIKEAGAASIPRMAGGLQARAAAEAASSRAAGTLAQPGVGVIGRTVQKADDLANRVMASQSGMTASQARKLGIKPVETFANINRRTGLTDLNDMAEVGRNLTGAGDSSILDTLTNAAIGEARGVKVNDLRATAQRIMDNGTSLLSDAERKRVLNNMKNASIAIHGGSTGSLNPLGDPAAALKQANTFREAARSLGNGFNVTSKDKQLAEIYNGVAADLEKSLYAADGVNQSIPLLTKAGSEDILHMANAAREAGSAAQAKAYERLAQEVRNAKSTAELRSLKKDFVNLGKIDKATAEAEGARTLTGQQFSTKAGTIAASPIKNGLGALIDAGASKGAGVVKNLTQMPLNQSAKSVGGQSLLGTATRQGLGRAFTADAPVQQSQVDENGLTQEDYQTLANEGITPDMISGQPQADMTAQQPSNPFGVSSAEIGQALMKAYMVGDKAAISQLSGMYDIASQYEAQQQKSTSMNATTQKALAQSANADTTLNQLEGLLNSAGGSQGPVGGNIASFLGSLGLNNNVKTYDDLAQGSVTQIARALGETGAMSDADKKAYMALIPKVNDTPQVAAAKFAALRARMQAAHQNTLQYGGGGSLEDLLAQSYQ